MLNYSNYLDQHRCPDCEASLDRLISRRFYELNDTLDDMIVPLNILKEEKSKYNIFQVEKHLGSAYALFSELIDAKNNTESHKEEDGDPRVTSEKNMIYIFEHLRRDCVYASGFSNLYEFIYDSRNNFIKYGKFFDITELSKLIISCKGELK